MKNVTISNFDLLIILSHLLSVSFILAKIHIYSSFYFCFEKKKKVEHVKDNLKRQMHEVGRWLGMENERGVENGEEKEAFTSLQTRKGLHGGWYTFQRKKIKTL